MTVKNWHLNIEIVAFTKREAKLLRALILDITDKHRTVSVSEIIVPRRRYRRRSP